MILNWVMAILEQGGWDEFLYSFFLNFPQEENEENPKNDND